jgi:hypothetical protein
MELFTQLFGDLLAFVYHCFDRIVIYGYLSGLSRPEQVVHFFRNVVGLAVVDKEVLSRRTADYQAWVEAFARNHRLPIEWAEKGVRKEDHVLPSQRRIGQGRTPTASISSSRAWSRGRAFASASPNTPARIQITASSPANAAASRTTTSTYATKPWARW